MGESGGGGLGGGLVCLGGVEGEEEVGGGEGEGEGEIVGHTLCIIRLYSIMALLKAAAKLAPLLLLQD